jgi:hypothetical protein
MPEGPLLHCAYCGDPIRYLGAEQAEAFIRHYYSCPQCGRVWTLSPAGHLEASASGLGDSSSPTRASGAAAPPAAGTDQA